MEAAKLFAKEGVKENSSSYDKDRKLIEKYPAYDEAFQMMMKIVKNNPEEKILLHSIGMLSAFRILIYLAERKQ